MFCFCIIFVPPSLVPFDDIVEKNLIILVNFFISYPCAQAVFRSGVTVFAQTVHPLSSSKIPLVIEPQLYILGLWALTIALDPCSLILCLWPLTLSVWQLTIWRYSLTLGPWVVTILPCRFILDPMSLLFYPWLLNFGQRFLALENCFLILDLKILVFDNLDKSLGYHLSVGNFFRWRYDFSRKFYRFQ